MCLVSTILTARLGSFRLHERDNHAGLVSMKGGAGVHWIGGFLQSATNNWNNSVAVLLFFDTFTHK